MKTTFYRLIFIFSMIVGVVSPALEAMPDDEKLLRYIMDSRRKAPHVSFRFERRETAMPFPKNHYQSYPPRALSFPRNWRAPAPRYKIVPSDGTMLFAGKYRQKYVKQYDVLSIWRINRDDISDVTIETYKCGQAYNERLLTTLIESHQAKHPTKTPRASIEKPGSTLDYRRSVDNTGITMSMRTAVLGEAYDKHQAFAHRILQEEGTSLTRETGAAGKEIGVLTRNVTHDGKERIEFDPASLIILTYIRNGRYYPEGTVIYRCTRWMEIDGRFYPSEVSMTAFAAGSPSRHWTVSLKDIVEEPLEVEFELAIPEGEAVSSVAWPEDYFN